MLLRSYLFKRVVIIGVGLMGGSLGLALKRHRLARQVIGVSHRQTALNEAKEKGAIDVGYIDVKKAVSSADLVVLAAPVDSIIKLFSIINPHIRRGCIITDMGSSKTDIVQAAERTLSFPGSFVGSHPLAGSEKKGVKYASANLFDGSICIMTPTEKTTQVARQKVKHLWAKLCVDVKILSHEEHDQSLACISHLPHLLAYGLIESIPSKMLELASGGLKDTTRIASSSPQLWNDICMSNSHNVIKALDQFVVCLAEYRKAIIAHNQKSLISHFQNAKEKRDKISQ